AERLQVAEQVDNLAQIGLLVDGCIRADQEPGSLGRLDPFNRLAEDARTLDAHVVSGFQTVEMHVEEKTRRWLEFVQAPADEHAVGAQVDVPLPREQLA